MTAIVEQTKEEIKEEARESKIKKESTIFPKKMKLPKWEKTGIISIFYWTPRRDRRKSLKIRVRNSSIWTTHPSKREWIIKTNNLKRANNLFKNTRKDLITK